MAIKIISGAQTGVDSGALLAAMELDLPWGGTAPRNWLREDGSVPPEWRKEQRKDGNGLIMMAKAGKSVAEIYRARTLQNIKDAGMTVVVVPSRFFLNRSRGTKLTVDLAGDGHPCLIVEAGGTFPPKGSFEWSQLLDTVGEDGVVNFAGPRGSHWEAGEAITKELVMKAYLASDREV